MVEREPVEMMFACIVIRRGTEVVIVRPTSPEGRAKWAFPAGRVGQDESPEAACRRVCLDRLGVEISLDFGQPPLQGEVGGRKVIYRYYFGHIPAGDVQNLDFAEVRWVHLADLAEYDFDPTTQMVVDWMLGKD